MIGQRVSFIAITYHPNGYHTGCHVIGVKTNWDGSLYCTSSTFGASRDFKVSDPKEAVRCWMREHGCTVLNITETDND